MKRVLLTGARGFVGRHCLAELSRRGFEVHAVSRCANVASRDPGVIWHQANLLDSRTTYDLVARVQPTELMHLAWITICGEYWESPENLSWVRAGLDLIEAFAQHGGRRVSWSARVPNMIGSQVNATRRPHRYCLKRYMGRPSTRFACWRNLGFSNAASP